MLLSIIIPVYNAEKYIRQTLDSILSQPFRDYELLLVNDGSTDGSLVILNEYAKKTPLIRVINKKNEGVSATRNRGIREAKGKFLYFMDADDLLHPKFLTLMTGELEKAGADIVVCDYTTFYTRPRYAYIPESIVAAVVENCDKQGFDILAQKGRATSLCNKFFPNLLQGGHPPIFLDEEMSYGEDMFFCWKNLLLAKKIILIEAPLYLYRQTTSGATSRFHGQLYERYKRASEGIVAFAESNGFMNQKIQQSVVYHLTRRLPALTSMENRAPYNHKEKLKRMAHIVNDSWIQDGLNEFSSELVGPIYEFARKRNYARMLRTARVGELKSRLLFPLKRFVK